MSAIQRFFVERKEAFRTSENLLLRELRQDLAIDGLETVRIFLRYDIDTAGAALPEAVQTTILSEPRVDVLYEEALPSLAEPYVLFGIESLPGQYDQRADSCAQAIELLTGHRPHVAAATFYAFFGNITNDDVKKIQNHLLNPVESRPARTEKPESLDVFTPDFSPVPVVDGFCDLDTEGLFALQQAQGLAMDLADLRFMQQYFIQESRNPTETELKVIDTYWSDHCRHTTFLTELHVKDIEDARVQEAYDTYLGLRKDVYAQKDCPRPVSLMDMGTIGAKYLKKEGRVRLLDESEEINACSVKMTVDTEKGEEPWLFMFKNETHNHPTEIEPFGGAATCLGGAIRDPLSGRSYVYQGLRLTGAADPRTPLADTLPGKLPQKRICTLAAKGFSSYGNQIGLATGLVDEIYHPGYEAKRMEVGAVIAAAPQENVVRQVPQPGDVVVLIGGRTGRDGCGGATGSSKIHTEDSLESSGAEVQKGNPVEERKIQRLFRRPEVARVIRRCNDFGAGGVSVAIGELADGLYIDLDRVPKKYAGLNGTELAISESQERMACVIHPDDWPVFEEACREENIECTIVAHVTEEKRLIMDWQGQRIVDLSRAFVDSAGAKRQMDVVAKAPMVQEVPEEEKEDAFLLRLQRAAKDINICSKRGLVEQFDATIGAGTVLMPFGGKFQLTPPQAMASLIPVLKGETDTASLFAYGFDPRASSKDPYMGAYDAVIESVCRLIATGTTNRDVYLSFQEYFHSLRSDAERWGVPFQSVLGALMAQLDTGLPSIGGKDSMSGSFEDKDVPPTLISFAATLTKAERVTGPELKGAGHVLAVLEMPRLNNGRIAPETFRRTWDAVEAGMADGRVLSCWAISRGGLAEGIIKMTVGSDLGMALDEAALQNVQSVGVGGFLLELNDDMPEATVIGRTIDQPHIRLGTQSLAVDELRTEWEEVLEDIYPTKAQEDVQPIPDVALCSRRMSTSALHLAKPRVLIPVFPGTNCEYDTARAFERAGAVVETVVVANQTSAALQYSTEKLAHSLHQSQILALPGGFSFGDEPDGSGKFIAAFFRQDALREALDKHLNQNDGLILGICNGFQVLVKLGLLPYGRIVSPTENDCTLTFNTINRHQSKYISTRIVSTASPWLAGVQAGDVHAVPISHGEGRFIAGADHLAALAEAGQIATQYVDAAGMPSMAPTANPNGSLWAIEGLLSPDGRILGKMGHSERAGRFIAKNVPGNKDQKIFESGVRYYTD